MTAGPCCCCVDAATCDVCSCKPSLAPSPAPLCMLLATLWPPSCAAPSAAAAAAGRGASPLLTRGRLPVKPSASAGRFCAVVACTGTWLLVAAAASWLAAAAAALWACSGACAAWTAGASKRELALLSDTGRPASTGSCLPTPAHREQQHRAQGPGVANIPAISALHRPSAVCCCGPR